MKYNGSIHRGDLILINSLYGYHESGAYDLLPPWGQDSSVRMNRGAALQLMRLMEKISGWGRIVPVSGWRSLQEQQSIWDSSMTENGMEFTKKYVAYPGHSEHQTGLAIDLGIYREEIDFIRPDFPCEGICQEFRNHAAGFGFVERYPAGKEAVTGIGHEPWHFRYVGAPHSFIMEEFQFTLEEYVDFLRDYPFEKRTFHYTGHQMNCFISYLKEGKGEHTSIDIDLKMPFSISGNNVDGYIITEWR